MDELRAHEIRPQPRWKAWAECFRQLVGIALLVALSGLSIRALFFRDRSSTSGEVERPGATSRTVLRVQNPPSESLGGTAWSKAQTMVFQRFRELHPDYEFEPASKLILPGGLSGSTDVLAFIGETAPDLFSLQDIRFSPYITQGFTLPLDALMQQDGYVLDASIPTDLRDLLVRGGQTYGLPGGRYLWGLTYRKDLYREVGLDPEHPPATWEELYDHCMRLTGRVTSGGITFRRVGLLLDRVGPGFWGDRQFLCFLLSAGGSAVERAEDGEWRTAFQEEPGVAALGFYRRLLWGRWTRCPHCGQPVVLRDAQGEQVCTDEALAAILADEVQCPTGHRFRIAAEAVEEGCARVAEKRQLAEFNEGRSGIQLLMPSLSVQTLCKSGPMLPPSSIGVAPMPRGPGANGAVKAYCEYTLLCLNGTLDPVLDADRLRAAWTYIKYMASDEVQRLRTQAYVDEGEHVFVEPVDLQKFGHEDALRDLPTGWREGFEAMARSATAIPPFSEYRNVVEESWRIPLESVFLYAQAEPQALLETAAHSVEASVLQRIPADKMKRLRRIAGGLLLAVLVLVLFGIRRQYGSLAAKVREDRGRTGPRPSRRIHVVAWTLLAPAVGLVMLWGYFPVGWGTLMAFFQFRILDGFANGTFVGLDNFIFVVLDPLFFRVILNTVAFVGLNLLLGFASPIILAVLLTEIPVGKVFFRTVYFLPAVTSQLVVVLLWTMFFAGDETGLLNSLLLRVGLPAQNWLGDPRWAMACTILPGVWSSVGPGCLIYLAALKCVPEDCYEAADLDGAGFLTKLRAITIPVIWPLILINFLGLFIRTFQGMGNILLMTGGGPLNATRVLGLEIWMRAFIDLDYGRSTSLAWILGSQLVGFTVMQLRLVSSMKFTQSKLEK